jgi:hypothetical protein
MDNVQKHNMIFVYYVNILMKLNGKARRGFVQSLSCCVGWRDNEPMGALYRPQVVKNVG